MTYDEIEPTGVHAEAIAHLEQARKRMAAIDIPHPTENLTLGRVYDQQFAQMIGSLVHDYRHRYIELATRPPQPLVIDGELREIKVRWRDE